MKKAIWAGIILAAILITTAVFAAQDPTGVDANNSREIVSSSSQQTLVRLTRYEGQRITGIKASAAFDVYLTQSSQTKAVVEINEELEQDLDLELEADGVLRISMRPGIRLNRLRSHTMKITVYLPELTYLKATGATTVYSTGNFTAQATVIDLSGASDIKSLNLATGRLKIDCTGASNANISGEATDLEARVSGASDINLSIHCQTAKLNSTGASDLDISGEAEEATITASGGSDINALEFAVKRVKVSASSASDARVWAVDSIDANASSASSIRYRGNPGSYNTKSSSAGSVRKAN